MSQFMVLCESCAGWQEAVAEPLHPGHDTFGGWTGQHAAEADEFPRLVFGQVVGGMTDSGIPSRTIATKSSLGSGCQTGRRTRFGPRPPVSSGP